MKVELKWKVDHIDTTQIDHIDTTQIDHIDTTQTDLGLDMDTNILNTKCVSV